MQRRLADAILKPYHARLADFSGAHDDETVCLVIDACIGDLRSLDRTIKEVDNPPASTFRA